MIETKKEKYIRFLLILFFICVVLVGFYLKYEGRVFNKTSTLLPVALVLKKTDGTINPEIVLYQHKQNKHLLAKYEIEMENNFYFRAMDAVELQDSVDEMFLDKEAGFWVEIDDRMYYFDSHLKQKERPEQYVGNSTASSFFYDNGTIQISGRPNKLPIEDKDIHQVHALSENDSLWLIIGETGVKISTIATK